MDDLAATTVQVVDHLSDPVLIARNRMCAQDHDIILTKLEPPRLTLGHQRHRCHRLTLGTRGEHADRAIGVTVDLRDVDHHPLGDGQNAEPSGKLHIVLHRSAERGDLAVVVRRSVDDLLDAVKVAGEAGHDDPTTRAHREDPLEGHADGGF